MLEARDASKSHSEDMSLAAEWLGLCAESISRLSKMDPQNLASKNGEALPLAPLLLTQTKK
jgi:hypothetical protein